MVINMSQYYVFYALAGLYILCTFYGSNASNKTEILRPCCWMFSWLNAAHYRPMEYGCSMLPTCAKRKPKISIVRWRKFLQTNAIVIDNHEFVIRRRHWDNWPSNTEQLQLNASDGEDADDTLVCCRSQPVSAETDHLHVKTYCYEDVDNIT